MHLTPDIYHIDGLQENKGLNDEEDAVANEVLGTNRCAFNFAFSKILQSQQKFNKIDLIND